MANSPDRTDQQLIQAWSEAASELQISVTTPYDLDFEGSQIACVAWLKDFGGRRGMLVLMGGDDRVRLGKQRLDRIHAAGYGISFLPKSAYRRERFVNMLADWTWTGDPSAAPPWLPDPQGSN
jgi:hypothetical protein